MSFVTRKDFEIRPPGDFMKMRQLWFKGHFFTYIYEVAEDHDWQQIDRYIAMFNDGYRNAQSDIRRAIGA